MFRFTVVFIRLKNQISMSSRFPRRSVPNGYGEVCLSRARFTNPRLRAGNYSYIQVDVAVHVFSLFPCSRTHHLIAVSPKRSPAAVSCVRSFPQFDSRLLFHTPSLPPSMSVQCVLRPLNIRGRFCENVVSYNKDRPCKFLSAGRLKFF
jgi:hypothetical protein